MSNKGKRNLAAKQNEQQHQPSDQQPSEQQQSQNKQRQRQPTYGSDLSEDRRAEQQALIEIKSAKPASLCSVIANFNLI